MFILEIYIGSSITWFIIFMIFGLTTRKKFIKNVKKMEKELKLKPKKKYGMIKTTLLYLLSSFIPVYRIFVMVSKLLIVYDVDRCIKLLKEKK